MATNISVRHQDKIRIQDLTPVATADKTKDKLDSSRNTRSYQLPISTLYSGDGMLVTDAAARRYHTEENELSAADLKLFTHYDQVSVEGRDAQKNVYFEEFPIVDNPKNIYELAGDQLMTKGNIPEFQEYIVGKQLANYASIPALNWENEDTPTHVKSFINFISKTRHDARATYKIMFDDKDRNPERVSNIVSLSKLADPDDKTRAISAAVHYSVAGIVSIKSNLDEQRSGTIYLEARKTNDKTADWQTIDSAVFKFISKKDWSKTNRTPGTYITLNGYLYTDFETRLKVNLHPHAYSMNLDEYRDTDYSLTNHYSNTFVGFIDIPNYRAETESTIYFSNINYASYLYGKGAIKFIPLQDTKSNRDGYPTVSSLLSDFGIPLNDTLEISTKTSGLIFNRNGFGIYGLRLSPMGKVYGLTEEIPVENGMTVYPAYVSGTIKTPRLEEDLSIVTSYGNGISWQQNLALNTINYSELSVISGLQWPENTDICGNITMDISAKNTQYGTTIVDGTGGTYSSDFQTSKLFTKTARSVATENPRVQYRVDRQKISFTPEGDLASNITCHISASPRTSGSGHGNESYGRILKVNADGSTSIVSATTLNTKNVSIRMTNGLCTGSRWNVKEKSLITADIIMPQYGPHYFYIEAAADTAADDGRKETIFTVSVSAVFDYYNKTFIPNPPEEQETVEIKIGHGTAENKMDCSVLYDKYAYADKVKSSSFTSDPPESGKQLTNNFNVQELSVTLLNFKEDDDDASLTQLSVCPHPQSVAF